MSEFEIRLTAEAEQNREETMRTLCEAAEEIGKSQEQDFQTLKERKWYQRLLKTVTFSNAAEQKKLLIKDVSSLSKLYEITLRALYLLWQDTDILTAQAEQQSALLETITAQNSVLFENQRVIVEQLLRLKYRHKQKSDLASLNEQAKYLIVSALYTISVQMQESSETAKEYVRAIMTYTKIRPSADITQEDVENLKNAEAELLYQILAEYQLFLDNPGVLQTGLADALQVSIKRRREIQEQVTQFADHLGKDVFLSYYQSPDDSADVQIDDDNLTLDNLENPEVAKTVKEEPASTAQAQYIENDAAEPAVLEEVVLPETWRIASGQTVQFKNKILHITSPIISCEGSLEFVNCEIHYGESPDSDSISLGSNSSLCMKQCTIICHAESPKWLFCISELRGTCTFERCYFYNCTHFLWERFSSEENACRFQSCSFSGGSKLFDGLNCIFSNCDIHQPEKNFVDGETVTLDICKIFLIYRAKANNWGSATFISGLNVKVNQCNVQGNLRFSSAEEAVSLTEAFELPYFSSGDTSITQSAFCGVYGFYNDCSATANLSIFDNCISLYLSRAQNCRFDRCLEPVSLSKGDIVSDCQFNQCYGAGLVSMCLGSKMDLCEFNGWDPEQKRPCFIRPLAMIRANCSGARKQDSYALISNCTFNGLRSRLGSVVAAEFCSSKAAERKIKVYKCVFVHCTTDRKDQALIQRNEYYTDLFKKQHRITVVETDDCKGLNQTWEDDTPREYTVMNETVSGQKLGCNDDLFVAFLTGALRINQTEG